MKISRYVIQTVFLLGLGLGLQAQAQTRTVHLYYTDPQGTVLAKTDAQGNVIAQYDYTPYGAPVTSLGGAPDGPGYTGHVNDPETGLVYMQARYYLPAGRFPSPDPIGPSPGDLLGFNRYAYAGNNPVTNIDPSGMDDCSSGQDGSGKPCPPSTPVVTLPSVTATATVWDGTVAGANDPVNAPNQPLSDVVNPNNPQRRFLPPDATSCTGMGSQFYAPPQFDLNKIVASGQTGGRFNLAAMDRAVGHFGTFDYQRMGTPSSFTFYSGYTPVSNIGVGAYLYGAGFSQSQAGMISNTFAALFSKNAGDPNQATYRNLGYRMAAGKESYSCSAIHQ